MLLRTILTILIYTGEEIQDRKCKWSIDLQVQVMLRNFFANLAPFFRRQFIKFTIFTGDQVDILSERYI